MKKIESNSLKIVIHTFKKVFYQLVQSNFGVKLDRGFWFSSREKLTISKIKNLLYASHIFHHSRSYKSHTFEECQMSTDHDWEKIKQHSRQHISQLLSASQGRTNDIDKPIFNSDAIENTFKGMVFVLQVMWLAAGLHLYLWLTMSCVGVPLDKAQKFT